MYRNKEEMQKSREVVGASSLIFFFKESKSIQAAKCKHLKYPHHRTYQGKYFLVIQHVDIEDSWSAVL